MTEKKTWNSFSLQLLGKPVSTGEPWRVLFQGKKTQKIMERKVNENKGKETTSKENYQELDLWTK